MTRKRLALALLVGLLVTAAASPAHAAGSRPGLAESWWSWFATWAQSVLGSGPASATGQADVGPMIDPFGGNRTTSGDSGQADSGPMIDPFGGNRTTNGDSGQSDVGIAIDPLGGK